MLAVLTWERAWPGTADWDIGGASGQRISIKCVIRSRRPLFPLALSARDILNRSAAGRHTPAVEWTAPVPLSSTEAIFAP